MAKDTPAAAALSEDDQQYALALLRNQLQVSAETGAEYLATLAVDQVAALVAHGRAGLIAEVHKILGL